MIKLNKIIKEIGLICGVFITRVTSKKDLVGLIKKLHPVATNYELVRVGPNGNGGYLLPNDFVGIEAIFSPGVGSVSLFENDCVKLGMKAFLADKSVSAPTIENKNFTFDKKFIGATVNDDFLTLDAWVDKSNINKDSDLLLQIDIEGYEYETILNVSNRLLDRFRIIVIEFHELDLLFSKLFFDKFSNVFDKILQGHECVHIHPNNCCKPIKKGNIEIPPVMEFTFLRKNRIKEKAFIKSFPHKLDFDSAKEKSFDLPKCWYAS